MALNSLLEGTLITGDLRSRTDLRIDGEIQGNILCEGRLVVGPTGIIKGNVRCRSARVEGQVEGNISVEEMLELKATSRIQGDLQMGKLIIEEGAVFNGHCKMAPLQDN